MICIYASTKHADLDCVVKGVLHTYPLGICATTVKLKGNGESTVKSPYLFDVYSQIGQRSNETSAIKLTLIMIDTIPLIKILTATAADLPTVYMYATPSCIVHSKCTPNAHSNSSP